MPDVIYEPRAFWEVRSISVGVDNVDPQSVVLDLQNFYNDARWPITITKIAVAPIGYFYRRFGDPSGIFVGPHGYVSSSLINLTKLVISARRRASFPSKRPILSSELANITVAPRSPHDDGTAPTQFSSWTGAVYKNFDFPITIPRDASFYTELTCLPGYPAAPAVPAPRWAVAFHERVNEDKALFPGYARIFDGLLSCGATPVSRPWPAISPIAPQTQGPFTNALFPPEQSQRSREFKSQSPLDEGAAEFYGMSAFFNQIGYDTAALAAAAGAVPLAVAPLSLQVGCRAQVREAGSQTRWWRAGAPVALVFDDIPPAIVYKLDKPITMDPGDQWEVELTVPGVKSILVDGVSTPAPATYQIGVSLNGYATIEG
jgi:hypothetical protein